MIPKKEMIGFWTALSLVVGNIIGSALFLLPSALANYGSISLLAWIATAIGALFVAFVFAHLGKLFPKTGGPYVYCHEVFGDFLGFQVAFSYWIAVWIANAALIVGMISYLSFFFPILATNHFAAFIVASVVLWIFTGINLIGICEAGMTQVILTVLKVAPLLLIMFIGLFFIHPHYLTAFNISHKSNMSAFTITATLTLWSLIGLESATIPAENVKNPTKNIPRATIYGTLIAAIIYIGSTAIVMCLMPMHQLAQSTAPFADIARFLFGSWGGWLVGLTAIIACAGALNGLIMIQGQVPFAAARDELFPKVFSKTSKNGTPYSALIISSILINILLAVSFNESLIHQYTLIILLATFTNIVPYLYTSAAQILISLRQKKKNPLVKIARPLIVAIVASLYVLWMIIGAGAQTVFYGMILIFASVLLYVWLKARQGKG